MSKQEINSRRGFTIIEVVLVLAIAGLIFLMVFLALPALQRSQRDTQRRSAYSEFLTQVSNYQANNRGKLPTSNSSLEDAWEKFISAYLRPTEKCVVDSSVEATDGVPAYKGTGDDGVGCDDGPTTFLDPVGEPYYIGKVEDLSDGDEAGVGKQNMTWDEDKYKINVYLKATCDGENAVTSDGARNIAIRAKLEGGGIYCGNN